MPDINQQEYEENLDQESDSDGQTYGIISTTKLRT